MFRQKTSGGRWCWARSCRRSWLAAGEGRTVGWVSLLDWTALQVHWCTVGCTHGGCSLVGHVRLVCDLYVDRNRSGWTLRKDHTRVMVICLLTRGGCHAPALTNLRRLSAYLI